MAGRKMRMADTRKRFLFPGERTMKSKIILTPLALLALTTLSPQLSTAFAQGTAFTYQGRLNDSTGPANGLYDFRFVVWDALTGGNIVAGPTTNSATGVTNGLFALTLDFGSGVFTGPGRWLQLDVRTNGSGSFAPLAPRQSVLPVPYALYAMTPAGPQGLPGPQGPPGTNGVGSFNGLTNSVTLTAGANMTLTTIGNTLQMSALPRIPDIQLFSTGGTFVVPTNVTKIMVELWGGGGGGGNGYNDGTHSYSGGGGGAGGYAWNVFNVTPNTHYSVVVGTGGNPGGAGGTTSFGVLLNATGGSPGGSATSGGNGAGGAGGVGGGSTVFPVTGSSGRGGGFYTGGGAGGQVWRGNNGPGRGGDGGWNGQIGGEPGESGTQGFVGVYY
jgi:hypothetical protein